MALQIYMTFCIENYKNSTNKPDRTNKKIQNQLKVGNSHWTHQEIETAGETTTLKSLESYMNTKSQLRSGCTQLLSCVGLFSTPWTVARPAPLSMGFSRQECWSELPFPSPEIGLYRPKGTGALLIKIAKFNFDELLEVELRLV